MKILIIMLFLACGFYLISCKSYTYHDYGIDEQLWKFSVDVIENPEKINSLQKYYPEVYNESYFDAFMKESMYRSRIIKNIKLKFNQIDDKERIEYKEVDRKQLLPIIATSIVQDSTISSFTQLIIRKNNNGIKFLFAKKGNEYYLCKIESERYFEYLYKELNPILMQLVDEIIENPEMLNNIKGNFPDFYNEDYLDNRRLGDSLHINKLIDFINLQYKKIDAKERLHVSEPNPKFIKKYININARNVNLSDFFDFVIWRKNIGINFIFIKNVDKYYICFINDAIALDYKED